MERYFIYLSYNGANYCGWQNQPNGVSVQQKIEESLRILLRKSVSIIGAGRTDAGVHARMMVAHFDWAGSADLMVNDPVAVGDPVELTGKLNRILPSDISIHKIIRVSPEAHARFDAVSRTYQYYISFRKDPFDYPFRYRIDRPLNFDKMNEAASVLFEYADFTSFSKLHTDVKTNLCRIIRAEWTQSGDVWVFTITADRFLRNMVRAIVGTLLDVGRGKVSIRDFRNIIESKDRGRAGISVPGNALFLTHIDYPPGIPR
ncbi:MAG: tRNA pseudouridine(38-40) synthase TruA [Dysgonamonadaceae bacterium]|jgi:tRNA pseudouridine38-40 synthase|nr:tRNA pseudouridine(38-40) synthase TruA [Dysgonamonadaceae bacterium]